LPFASPAIVLHHDFFSNVKHSRTLFKESIFSIGRMLRSKLSKSSDVVFIFQIVNTMDRQKHRILMVSDFFLPKLWWCRKPHLLSVAMPAQAWQ
jgi:hypothetical protein